MDHTLTWLKFFLLGLLGLGFGLTTTPVEARSRVGWDSKPENTPAGLTTADWRSIVQEYQRHRHAAFAVGGGYQARSFEQQWLARFDGRGFTVAPDSGEWQWGLELESYGIGGHEQRVVGRAQVRAALDRVSYRWDERLEEWFVNDQRGLEHGFTVRERPRGGAGPLVLNLAVRGGLQARVEPGGQGVRFCGRAGEAAVHYTGLRVWDAAGRRVAARFEQVGEGLRLEVEESGARYPLTIDPIAQQAYLKASNTGAFDFFGLSVAVAGDTVVVGASGEASNATGVNGNQSDNSAFNAGAAYVFVRNAGVWSQQAYLKASNTGARDDFGVSVAVSGDTVVVGARLEASNATGVNGDGSNNSALQSGAAYVFVRNAGVWSQQAYLKASNTGAGDEFGVSVAVSGDTVVVGARLEDSNATGVNGNQSDNSASASGAAYMFVRNAGVWSQQAYLKAYNTGADDGFGISVAVSGDTVVVGARLEDSNATGVNGNQSDNSASDSGAAYVFVRNAGVWSQQAYLKASNTGPGDLFGFSVAVSGDTVVVGAIFESSNATGVNGNQSDNSASFSGAAYVFVRNAGVWSQQAYLKASNTGLLDQFGASVAVSGDTVVVGASGEDSNATGVNGNQSDNSASFSGVAYMFVRNAGVWSQQAYLKASNTGINDAFGAVAVSGDTVVVGASGESSNATGVNGNQSDNSASASGAAYVFGPCGHHTVHGHLSTAVPSHSGAFDVHHGTHGHTIADTGCVPHVPGHGAGLTMDASEGELGFTAVVRGDSGDRIVELFGSAAGLFLGESDDVMAAGFTPPVEGPLYYTTEVPEVRLGGQAARVLYSGLAPGLTGVWQINVELPEQAPADRLPLILLYGGSELDAGEIEVR